MEELRDKYGYDWTIASLCELYFNRSVYKHTCAYEYPWIPSLYSNPFSGFGFRKVKYAQKLNNIYSGFPNKLQKWK